MAATPKQGAYLKKRALWYLLRKLGIEVNNLKKPGAFLTS
jgi:hypothetical protein